MKKLNILTALVLIFFGTAIPTHAACHCLPNSSTSFFPRKVFEQVAPGNFCTDHFTKNMPVAKTCLSTMIDHNYSNKGLKEEINNSAFKLVIDRGALFNPGNILKTV